MKYLLLSFLFITLLGCSKTEKKELPFDSFVYSFSAQALDYSIQFNSSDTVYFTKRRPEPATNSYAIIDGIQKDSLVALAERLDFSKYGSSYEDKSIMDAGTFKFVKLVNGKEKSISVYGTKAPEELYRYAAKLNEHIKRLDFKPYKGKIDSNNQ